MRSLIEIIKNIMANYYLCDKCLGRLFGGLSTGLTNEERGRIIREYIKMDIHYRIINEARVTKKLLNNILLYYSNADFQKLIRRYNVKIIAEPAGTKTCFICRGMLETVDEIAREIQKSLSDVEFETFQVGVQKITEIEEREEEIKRKYGIWFGENIRNELSREIGKALVKSFNSVGKDIKYSNESPDLMIIVDPINHRIERFFRPIKINVKVIRINEDAPIFGMKCSKCGGLGCDYCKYTGREPGKSFESSVGLILLDYYKGDKWKFGIKYMDKEKNMFVARFKIINPKKRRDAKKVISLVNKRLGEVGFKLLSIDTFLQQ